MTQHLAASGAGMDPLGGVDLDVATFEAADESLEAANTTGLRNPTPRDNSRAPV